jgi:phosphohistidine phosphatase
MAKRFARRGPRPERIVTSSAVRARATAEAFASELELDAAALVVRPEIYGAAIPEMMELIRQIDDRLMCVMIVGHNPTLSELAQRLAGPDVGNLATCAVVTLGLDGRGWADVAAAPLQILDLDFPKKDT